MKRDDQFSDEFLNSLVDDQLAHEEKSHAYTQINKDEALSKRVCELRKLSDLVKLAYKNPPASSGQPYPDRLRRNFSIGVAAGLALFFGVVLGWFIHHVNPTGNSLANQLETASTGDTAADVQAKVMFHIGTNDIIRMDQTLDEVEHLLEFYHNNQQQAHIDVITNGDGLNLLLTDTSPFPGRIQRMQKDYPNLKFIACQNTIERYTDNGFSTRLLPGVIVIDSGVAEIMRRQQQGWAYIQV
jgi:intracellular sulfur oxidation DsrE/DsrF family protein